MGNDVVEGNFAVLHQFHQVINVGLYRSLGTHQRYAFVEPPMNDEPGSYRKARRKRLIRSLRLPGERLLNTLPILWTCLSEIKYGLGFSQKAKNRLMIKAAP